MTQEEKAKAYDKALVIARSRYSTETEESVRICLELMFPELAESEDERIRKALIENFKFFGGEHLKTSKWGKDDDLLVTDILAWLEKQGEQKPAEWDDDDEGKISSILYLLHTLGNNKFDNWLKSLKERFTWKPSESDILLLERIANGKSNPQDFQASLCNLIEQLKKLMEE